MKAKPLLKTVVLVLTLATLLSSMAILATVTASAADYTQFSGSTLNSYAGKQNITTKATSNGWSFSTGVDTNNVPKISYAAIGTALKTHPYLVIRYQSSCFSYVVVETGGSRGVMPMPQITVGGNTWGCVTEYFPNASKFDMYMDNARGHDWAISEIVCFQTAAAAKNYCKVFSNVAPGGTGKVFDVSNLKSTISGEVYWGYSANTTGATYGRYAEINVSAGTIHSGGYNYIGILYQTDGNTTFRYSTDASFGNSVALSPGYGNNPWRWTTIKAGGSSINYKTDATIRVIGFFCYNNESDLFKASFGTWDYFQDDDYNTAYYQSVGTCPGGTYQGYHRNSTGASFVVGNATVSTLGTTYFTKVADHATHNADNVVTVEATLSTPGSITTSCSLCGDNKTVTTITRYRSGDVNRDEQMDAKDVAGLMKYVSNDTWNVEDWILDTNGDGRINPKDIVRLTRYLAGTASLHEFEVISTGT